MEEPKTRDWVEFGAWIVIAVAAGYFGAHFLVWYLGR